MGWCPVFIGTIVSTCSMVAIFLFYYASFNGFGASDNHRELGQAYGPIDVVYTWVNGSDPKWKAEKHKYHLEWILDHQAEAFLEHKHEEDMLPEDDNRFRDNEELRYSLRSIAKYAPWVRNVYIVTSGQIPYWIDLENPRLHIIQHADIFADASHLPVFSSPAIESQLDHIPGLSSNFLYLNDDVFFGAPVFPEDFVSPTGTQLVYLSWNVPDCAQSCRHSQLNDGYCDPRCNVTMCDFDMGDCGCTEDDETNEVTCDATSAKPFRYSYRRKKNLQTHRCTSTCRFGEIGNGDCNPSCDKLECGFDAGDCVQDQDGQVPNDFFTSIPSVSLSKKIRHISNHNDSRQTQTLVVPDRHSAIYVNMSDIFQLNGSIDRAEHFPDSGLIKATTFFEDQMILLLVFGTKRTQEENSQTFSRIDIVGQDGQHQDQHVVLHVLRGNQSLINTNEVRGGGTEEPVAVVVATTMNPSRAYEDEPEVDRNKYLDSAQLSLSHEYQCHTKRTFSVSLSIPMHAIYDWSAPIWTNASFHVWHENGIKVEEDDPSTSKMVHFQHGCIPLVRDEEDKDAGKMSIADQVEKSQQDAVENQMENHVLKSCHVHEGIVSFNIRIFIEEIDSVNEMRNAKDQKASERIESKEEDHHRNTTTISGKICLVVASSVDDNPSLSNIEDDGYDSENPICFVMSSTLGQDPIFVSLDPPPIIDFDLEGMHQCMSHLMWTGLSIQCPTISLDELEAQAALELSQRQEVAQKRKAAAAAKKLIETKRLMCLSRLENQENEVPRGLSFTRHLMEVTREVLGFELLLSTKVEKPRTDEDLCDFSDTFDFQNNEKQSPLSSDTFGDSLRHVNKLYNRAFGKPTLTRKVPSHMPHLIQKQVMVEMKEEFAAEFRATSSHRFRHPKDMQFGFSYIYYLIERVPVRHAPTLVDIWNTYLDTNGDGRLDENEVLTLASIAWGDYPPLHYIDTVKKCLAPDPDIQRSERIFRRYSDIQTIFKTIQRYSNIHLKPYYYS